MKNSIMSRIKKFVIIFLVAIIVFVQPINMFPGDSALNSVITAEAAVVKLNKTKLTLNVGGTYTLKLSGSKKKVTWSSSKKSVASVSSKGAVKARKKGSAVITAKAGKKKYSCKVTVKAVSKKKVSSVKLNYTSALIEKKNGKVTLKAIVGPKTAVNKKVKWTSSDKKIATVSQKGVVKAVGNGVCKVTAKAMDGSGKKASCTVRVNYEEYIKAKGVTFNVTNFPEEIRLDEKRKSSDMMFDVAEMVELGVEGKGKVTYRIDNGNAQLVFNDQSPNLLTSWKESIEAGYYVSDWKNRIAYVEVLKNNKIRIFPEIKKGSFKISAFYNHRLIRTCTVIVDYVGKDNMEFRKWVDNIEKKAWTSGMTEIEKLRAIESYIWINYDYVKDGIWCNQGARALLYAANDLGLKARYRYVGRVNSYNYEAINHDLFYQGDHAQMLGHVCTIVTIDGEDYIFETNGHY